MTMQPPPTMQEWAEAAKAAMALRDAIADPAKAGEKSTTHVHFSRPRRGEWWETWANLPGFTRITGSKIKGPKYTHTLLPGWEYDRDEIKSEMIPDLEALAERGARPIEATR